QSRLSTGVRGVGVDSCTKKAVDHSGIAVQSGKVDRRDAVTCSNVHFCARFDQQLGSFEIILAGGPMESRHPVNLCGVDVGLLLQQRTDSVAIGARSEEHTSELQS